MTDASTHNLNLAECLHKTMNWGETIVHNICSGEQHTVPWGSVEYLWASILIAILGVVAGIFASVVYDMWKWRNW